MAEKPQSASMSAGSDDAMVELTQRARAISQEAGSKVTSAMRGVIGSAAGIAGFAVESARDLVQYMVRRGQMTQDEADKLIREAEATHLKRPKAERERMAAEKLAADKRAAEKKAAMLAAEQARPVHRPVGPGRLLAQGAGKSVKGPPAKTADAPKPEKAVAKQEKPTAKSAEKPVGKPEKPTAKSAEKPAAKVAAPVKAAAKSAPAKSKAAAPVKKSAAKAPAKKSVKKKK